MSSLNKQTVNTVADILSFHATPVSIASGVQNATKGEVIDTSLAAANAVQSFGAIMSTTLGKAAPHLLAANLFNDGRHMHEDHNKFNGKYSDATLTSAASNIAAAAAYAATFAAGGLLAPAAALTLAAACITASAALGVAALSQNPNSTARHDQINLMLGKAMDLAAQTGSGLGTFFARQGNSLESGISRYFDSMSGGFLNFSFGFGNALNRVERGLTSSLQSLFSTAQSATIPVYYAPPKPRKTGHCPLVLDLDGDGLETVGTQTGAYFDHDANGFAELTGWAGKDDGLLVWDRNGNGRIDSGRELFGDRTQLKTGQLAADGYAALAEWDDNKDGRIDANDSLWANLKVWRDGDGDGYSGAGELHTLSALGIQSLSLAHATGNVADGQGNTRTHLGGYTRTDGATRQMGDFLFQHDTARTLATEYLDIPDAIAALPNLMGFGNLHDLDQAMVRDTGGALKNLVTQFQTTTDATARAAVFEQLLFKWAGVDGIAANSRGGAVDARRLALLEKFLGQDYTSQYGANPIYQAAPSLNQAYQRIADTFNAQLMAQTHYKPYYDAIGLAWEEATQTLVPEVSGLATLLRADHASQGYAALVRMADLSTQLKLLGDFGTQTVAALATKGNAGNGNPFDFLLAAFGATPMLGDGNSNNMNATSGSDSALMGFAGNDALYGGTGNDWLSGGIGADHLSGGAGNDTYVFNLGDGQDTIYEQQGSNYTDVLKLGVGIRASDISVGRNGDNLELRLANSSDKVFLQNWTGGADYRIDRVDFADGASWSQAQLQAWALNYSGTAGYDYMNGMSDDDTLLGLGGDDQMYGNAGNDRLDGGAGNDSLSGGNGDDTLIGGTGTDYLNGGAGNDTYVFNLGDGVDTISEQQGMSYTDVLKLGAGIKAADISVGRNGDNLELRLANSSDKVILQSWTGGDSFRIDRVDFADATSWSKAQLQAWALNYSGTAGNDSLSAMSDGDNILNGLGGNDWLHGSSGNDTLIGGTGTDYLAGGTGNDTYVFNLGDGVDTISEQQGMSYTDVLKLGVGIQATGISVGRNGNDLELRLVNGSDKVILQSWTGGDSFRIDRVDFADATSWSKAQLQAWALNYSGTAGNDSLSAMSDGDNILNGLGGNDWLHGSSGNDTLTGGTGTDYLNGGAGNDTYVFNLGDGVDTISDYDSSSGNQDIARFGAGINYDQLWLKRTGNDLEASVIGTADKVTIQNWYAGSANHVERFEAGGRALLDSKVDLLVQAMAAFAPPAAGQSTLPDTYRQVLAPVLAANWQ